MGLREWIIPQEKVFFDFLERQIGNVALGAKFLDKLIKNYKNLSSAHNKMKQIEHAGDEIVHEFYHKLDRSFITPFDHEDLTLLVSLFDDILDRSYAVVNRLYYYKIKSPTPGIRKFSAIITKQIVQIQNAVKRMRKMEGKEIDRGCVEVHRLENQGDELLNKSVARLFEQEKDALTVIKLKEIYEILEVITDKGEDAALAIRQIVIKNA